MRAVIVDGIGVLATFLFVVAGIAALLFGFGGIAWLAAGVMLSYVCAIEEAWVLLVEINRCNTHQESISPSWASVETMLLQSIRE